ncbi:MAG: uracil-DNA glycosylase family protein [Patescibacteria group bacterium]
MLEKITLLEDLWVYTKALQLKNFPNSTLEPILGGGRLSRPKFMFVFINPTYKNISSDPSWVGKRRPWTGTKYIWRIFNKAGHFDNSLLQEIEKTKIWSVDFADKVYSHLSARGFYFTNIVKWTGENADLPDSQKVRLFLPLLKKELEIVKPSYIVTFGLIPFKALTGLDIKLRDYFDASIKLRLLETFNTNLVGDNFKIIPCYFPVGRGDPKRAVELLRLLPS